MNARAILVEDNSSIRTTLAGTLRELAQMEVVALADTPADALRASARCEWDFMVLDLFLKEGTGLSVLAGLQRRDPVQRVVVLTNCATSEVRRHCTALGADAVYDKTTELEAFFNECANVRRPDRSDGLAPPATR